VLETIQRNLHRVTTLGLPMTAPAPYSSSLPTTLVRLALESATLRRVLKLPEHISPELRAQLLTELAVQESVPESERPRRRDLPVAQQRLRRRPHRGERALRALLRRGGARPEVRRDPRA